MSLFRAKVPAWALVLALIWGPIATVLVYRNPLPVPDWGHRTFQVPDEKAARVVANLLKKDGLGEDFTFKAGPTQQTVLHDNRTVLLILPVDDDSPGNSISLAVADPEQSANRALKELWQQGFAASTKSSMQIGNGHELVIVKSAAFVGWVLVYRESMLKLGMPDKFFITR